MSVIYRFFVLSLCWILAGAVPARADGPQYRYLITRGNADDEQVFKLLDAAGVETVFQTSKRQFPYVLRTELRILKVTRKQWDAIFEGKTLLRPSWEDSQQIDRILIIGEYTIGRSGGYMGGGRARVATAGAPETLSFPEMIELMKRIQAEDPTIKETITGTTPDNDYEYDSMNLESKVYFNDSFKPLFAGKIYGN